MPRTVGPIVEPESMAPDSFFYITVIIPAYNAESTIGSAVASALAQTWQDFELLVIDDGSRDGTIDVVRGFCDPRIRIISFPMNRGICHARNEGLRQARGRWIAPLDADDEWHPSRLKTLIDIAPLFPDSFIATDLQICISGKHGELIPTATAIERCGWVRPHIFEVRPIEFVTHGLSLLPMFPLRVVRERRLIFREEFRGHDWLHFILNLYRVGLRYIVINEPLYSYRINTASDSVRHETMVSQVTACQGILDEMTLDPDVREALLRGMTISQHRRLTTAIMQKRWALACREAVHSPRSLAYLLQRIPKWLARKIKERRMSQGFGP